MRWLLLLAYLKAEAIEESISRSIFGDGEMMKDWRRSKRDVRLRINGARGMKARIEA